MADRPHPWRRRIPTSAGQGSDHPCGARHYPEGFAPVPSSGRARSGNTVNTQFVDTCFGTHHLQFAYDERNTLWTSGGGDVVGWLDTTAFLETGDAERRRSSGHRLVLDTNGNGRLDDWTEPGEDPGSRHLDMRVQ